MDIPVDVQTSAISSDLNSVIFFVFLTGMYTVIYFGTLYIYLTKKPSKYYPVPAAITILYSSNIGMASVQWYFTKWQFIDNGDTRQTVFLAEFIFPPWGVIVSNTLNCIAFVIADGLLIWRCFYVWNRSWRIISASLLLLLTEFALYLVVISFNIRYGGNGTNESPSLAARLDAVLSAAIFMSFGTTLVTTILIAYRIYSVSKQEGVSSRRFKRVIDIVVQSGTVYALSQLTDALPGILPGVTNLNTKISIAFSDYTQLLSLSIAGIAATIMVARVAMLAADTTYPSNSIHLSGLQFHEHSTNQTVDRETFIIEGQTVEEEAKAQ